MTAIVAQTMPHDPRDPIVLERPQADVLADYRQAEAMRRDAVADSLAQNVYGQRTIGHLGPSELAAVRFVATLALRRLNPSWVERAREQAEQVCRTMLAENCGGTISRFPERFRGVVANLLAARVVAAYLAVLEDTAHVEPGDYLAIVGRQQ